jgi:hypothetical protein
MARLRVALAVFVLIGLTTGASNAATSNLLPNGDFENGTTAKWKGTNATLSPQATDVHSGSWAARVGLSGTSKSYAIVTAPRPITGTASGSVYSASAWVKGSGKTVCLKLHEYNTAGSLVKTSSKCTTSTAWTQLSIPSHPVVGNGDSIALIVSQGAAVAGNAFLLDDAVLTKETAGGTSDTGVVALWHMDETSGQMIDSAVNGSAADNGTITNVQRGVLGSPGLAYRFKGSSSESYVTVPHSADLTPGSADFSFSAKVRFTVNPSATVVDYDLLRKGLSTTPGGDYKMEILGSGKAFCQWKGSAGNTSIRNNVALNDGRWHTVTCIKTTSQVKIRVDGTLKTKAFAVGSITNTAALFIGSKPNADEYLGDMDEAFVSKP